MIFLTFCAMMMIFAAYSFKEIKAKLDAGEYDGDDIAEMKID